MPGRRGVRGKHLNFAGVPLLDCLLRGALVHSGPKVGHVVAEHLTNLREIVVVFVGDQELLIPELIEKLNQRVLLGSVNLDDTPISVIDASVRHLFELADQHRRVGR